MRFIGLSILNDNAVLIVKCVYFLSFNAMNTILYHGPRSLDINHLSNIPTYQILLTLYDIFFTYFLSNSFTCSLILTLFRPITDEVTKGAVIWNLLYLLPLKLSHSHNLPITFSANQIWGYKRRLWFGLITVICQPRSNINLKYVY